MYLETLLKKEKWQTATPPLEIGNLVVVKKTIIPCTRLKNETDKIKLAVIEKGLAAAEEKIEKAAVKGNIAAVNEKIAAVKEKIVAGKESCKVSDKAFQITFQDHERKIKYAKNSHQQIDQQRGQI